MMEPLQRIVLDCGGAIAYRVNPLRWTRNAAYCRGDWHESIEGRTPWLEFLRQLL